MQEAGKAKVQHGTAYGTCVCGHAEDESENESFCKVSETDAQNMPIVCHPGFSLKVFLSFPSILLDGYQNSWK